LLLALRQSPLPNTHFSLYGARAHTQSRNRALALLLCIFLLIFYAELQNFKPLKFTGATAQATTIAMRVVPLPEFLEKKKFKKHKLKKMIVNESEFSIVELPVLKTPPPPKPKEKIISKPSILPKPILKPVPKAVAETKVELEPAKLAKENMPEIIASAASIAISSTNTQADEQAVLLAAFRQEIERHKKYPRLARRRSIEGTIGLLITLDTRGNVIACRLNTDKGAFLLKKATLTLGKKMLGFASKICASKQSQIHIPIKYSLSDQ